MEYVIRKEDWRDFPRIAELHAEAFDYDPGMGEVGLVDALRRRTLHAPELSLVAKSEGRVVGHVMFSLYETRIAGNRHRASIMAPVAVDSGFRRHGVAAALIEEGHRIVEGMGVKIGFVLGNPQYYSRFGYSPGMFGACRLRAASGAAPAVPASPLVERRVRREDIAELSRMWELWYGDVDLSLAVGEYLSDWISPDKRFRSVVLERDGGMIGFVKYREDRPHAPDMLIARDGDAMDAVLGHLSSLSPQPLSLPLHPHSRAVKQLMRMPLEPEMKAWDAGMLRAFGTRDPEPEVEAYINEVSDGRRLPGLVIWPSAFDVCS